MYGSKHGDGNLGAQTQLQAKTTSTPLISRYQGNLLMPTEHERLGASVMCVDTWDVCPPTFLELLMKLQSHIQAIHHN